jgi:O-succinylbenzoate synthase
VIQLDKYCPELRVLAIPLRNKFRGITVREVVLFRGEHGWSEFGPFLEYDDREASTWMRASLEAAHNPWPYLYRHQIPINATLPIVEPAEVPEILRRFTGAQTVKIKVDDFESGAKVVEAALEWNPDFKIRLDVNGGWDSDTAISNLLEYHLRFGSVFEYVEQPCASLSELARVKAESPIRIAADEAIRKNLGSDLSNVSEYADVAILKWQPLGGFEAAHELAQTINLPVVISSALETGIGISHGLALAASFERQSLACGLGTVALFESDICSPAVLAHDGFLEVARREPVVDERYLASSERVEYWKKRILRVLEFIERSEE